MYIHVNKSRGQEPPELQKSPAAGDFGASLAKRRIKMRFKTLSPVPAGQSLRKGEMSARTG